MYEKEKVCIKCRPTGNLKTVRVCDRENVVGVLYCCAICFHEIQKYRLDIYFTERDKASFN